MFEWLWRNFFIVVGSIHSLVEPTKLANLQIPDENGNHDSKEAIEEVQYTEDQCEFGLGRVGRFCAREILTATNAA